MALCRGIWMLQPIYCILLAVYSNVQYKLPLDFADALLIIDKLNSGSSCFSHICQSGFHVQIHHWLVWKLTYSSTTF